MRIYLGGKMSGKSRGDNWRIDIVDSSAWHGPLGGEFCEANGAELNAGCGAGVPPEEWPVLPKAIFGKHDYVGPYLVGCDHGCFHSGDHATSIAWGHADDDTPSYRESNRKQISYLCTHAMVIADVLLFWFDGLDAYGTLAELVFASTFFAMNESEAKRNGLKGTKKHIFVASPSFDAIDEMWLAFRLSSNVYFVEAPTPKGALIAALASIEEPLDLSPIEKQFIESWRTIYGNGIRPQYNVPGFKYRVDFAFPDDKIAVELDGYEYHNSKEQFTNDRKRQREMELAGWRFIRFSGSEVYNNADACVRQAYEFWQSVAQAKA